MAAVAGAIAVSLVAPAAAEAASTNQGSSQGNSAKSKRNDVKAKQKAKGSGSGSAGQGSPQRSSGASSSGQGHTPAAQPRSKPAQRKDAPPDRDPHKFSPKQPSQAGDSASGRDSGSAPKSRVGVERPDDRGPNKVAPQQRKPATTDRDRDNDRRDKPRANTPRQATPGRAGLGGSALQQLETWTPPKPEANRKPGFHDLANRYRIVNGVPVGPGYRPLDVDSDAQADEVYTKRFPNGTEFVVVNGACYLNGVGLPGSLGAGSCASLAHDFDIWLEWGAGNIVWSDLEGQEDAAERLLNAYCQDRADACGPELSNQLANLDLQPVPVRVENGIGSVLTKILRIGARVPALKNLAPKTDGWLPQSALNKLPDEWAAGIPNRDGIGFRFFGPNARAQGVRFDKGNPASPNPSQQVDHVVVRDGFRVIGRDGKPISGPIEKNPDAHIPLSEWSKWSTWNAP